MWRTARQTNHLDCEFETLNSQYMKQNEENEALNDYYIPANLLPVNAENIDIPVEESVRESVDIDVSKYLKENPKKHIDDKLADRDLYTTKELAELRAIEMGGSGSHKIAGHYMPFKSHKEYVESKRYLATCF